MKRLFVFVASILILPMTACSAAQAPSATAASSGNQDHSKQLYINVEIANNLPYLYDHQIGTSQAGKELGVQTKYVGPADYDVNAQVTAFEQAIAEKPNGIVVMGVDPSLNVEIEKAMAAGIPVVTVDSDLPDSGRVAFVGTGNVAAGELGAEYIAKVLGGKGQVAIMTKPGQSNLDERVQGYQNALAKYAGIKVVQIVDTGADSVIAAQAAATILQKYPDLGALICVESAGGTGAATAVKEAGKQGQVKIISMDRDNAVIQAILDGTVTATVAQQTALMSYYAIEILYNLNNSDVKISTDNKKAGITGTPVNIDTGAVIVDKKNAQYFLRKN